jgi:hypothetical protein
VEQRELLESSVQNAFEQKDRLDYSKPQDVTDFLDGIVELKRTALELKNRNVVDELSELADEIRKKRGPQKVPHRPTGLGDLESDYTDDRPSEESFPVTPDAKAKMVLNLSAKRTPDLKRITNLLEGLSKRQIKTAFTMQQIKTVYGAYKGLRLRGGVGTAERGELRGGREPEKRAARGGAPGDDPHVPWGGAPPPPTVLAQILNEDARGKGKPEAEPPVDPEEEPPVDPEAWEAMKTLKKNTKTLEDLKKMMASKPTEPKVIETGPKGVPIIMPDFGIGTRRGLQTGLQRALAKKDKSGITINVKQIQNEKNKRRTKTVKKAKKSSLAAARKRYTKLKKDVIKAIRVAKKKMYDDVNKKIKQLKPSQRKAARSKVKEKLKMKIDALLKKIPPVSSYANIANIESGIGKLRKIKW